MNALRLLASALALASLGSLAARGHDSTVWLSSLDLTKAHVAWKPMKADRSVDGHPLTLSGTVYPKGVGLLARSQFVVQLDGRARWFKAIVGVDDEAPAGKGSVEFRVFGDGRVPLWMSGVMRQGDTPKSVDVDISNVKLLTLVVSEAMDGGDNDDGDWAEARFEGVTGAIAAVDANVPAFPVDPKMPIVISTAPEPAAPQLHAPFVTAIRPGTPFLHRLSATGEAPLSFWASGLPVGVAIDPASGILSGEIARAGTTDVHVTVRNPAGATEHDLRIVAGRALALTPPMGWNSYDNYGAKVTEAEYLANARVLAHKLQPFGWQYAVVDFLWFDPNPYCPPQDKQPPAMDAYGRLMPAPNRFPSAANGVGFKAIADQIHAMGLRFGIHIMRGIPRAAVKANLPILGTPFHAADAADVNDTCGWNEDMYGVRNTPAGQAYYDSIFRLYESWGVDFIKVDDISSPYHKAEIGMVRRAIDALHRSIVLSLSPGTAPLSETKNLIQNAQMWRETGDFWDNWDQLEDEFHKGAAWRAAVGPGHWPDADMLPIGHIGQECIGLPRQSNFTHPEQVTLLTLWSILPSPLMLGSDLTQLDPWTLALITNPEVLAVNQDPLGCAGRVISTDGQKEVWLKRLSDGSLALGFFNRSCVDGPVALDTARLGLKSPATVRDLWARRDLGPLGSTLSIPVPAHGAALLLVRPL